MVPAKVERGEKIDCNREVCGEKKVLQTGIQNSNELILDAERKDKALHGEYNRKAEEIRTDELWRWLEKGFPALVIHGEWWSKTYVVHDSLYG